MDFFPTAFVDNVVAFLPTNYDTTAFLHTRPFFIFVQFLVVDVFVVTARLMLTSLKNKKKLVFSVDFIYYQCYDLNVLHMFVVVVKYMRRMLFRCGLLFFVSARRCNLVSNLKPKVDTLFVCVCVSFIP